MESIDPRQLLAKIASILEQLNIAYMVTGGMAVFVWGRPRFTADIDMIIKLETKNVNSLASALLGISELGYVDKDVMREALVRRGEFNFIDGLSGVKVDFWVMNKSDLETEGFKRRITKDITGQQVYFISPEDLVLKKLLWFKETGSSRHLEDAQSIVKISKLDKKYLKKWAAKLDIGDKIKDLLK